MKHRLSPLLALLIAFPVCGTAVKAAGIDSRAYSCADLQRTIAARGFVFISAPAFGDFVVANGSFCHGDDRLQTRSVATQDQPECPVNYCEPHTSGLGN